MGKNSFFFLLYMSATLLYASSWLDVECFVLDFGEGAMYVVVE